ncbi:MAG TPA: hypothetical protein VFL90_15125 [Methylomirabilota bacterium]|nr:hypothetical protein [Methylomirabilota bacterium]
MGAAARRATALAVAALALGACAGRRIEHGVYHAPSGYRVAVPGEGWDVVDDARADLELRRRAAPAGMLVNGLCDARTARHDWPTLSRQLLLGLRDRVTLASDDVPVNGHLASHRLLEGRMRDSDERVRIEAYTLKEGRCVYDLLYVAPPADFDAGRSDFTRFVESFRP